jgi:spore maturation protein CgeB
MEALCGGSLVMTDYMLSLPEGLQDGQHLVMFSGMEEMRRKVLYYLQNDDERLQIAQAGYSEVMNHHRSWHRVEEFILKHVT